MTMSIESNNIYLPGHTREPFYGFLPQLHVMSGSHPYFLTLIPEGSETEA
jgi:hypothetical protein